MNVLKTFRTAAFLAASVAPAAFAPAALAAIQDGQCASLSDLRAENQGSVLESQKLTSDGHPLPTKLMYTSTPTGSKGYEIEWTPGSECFLVNRTLADIRMQDPNSTVMRADFLDKNAVLRDSLANAAKGGGRPYLQATVVSGADKGSLLTVAQSGKIYEGYDRPFGLILLSQPAVTRSNTMVYNLQVTQKASPLYAQNMSPSLAAN